MYNDNLNVYDVTNQTDVKDAGRYCCEKTEKREFDVALPIDVRPDVKVGKIKTECLGTAKTTCCCNPDNSECELEITQKFCVKIPVCFDIDTKVGKATLDCCDK